ncbi:DUF1361 domain-containing protein [Aureispira anguillae]|uniref:DUF1361 domain-containing protein n=1 Tax=Aureispira anguillae TaxID=2864201 RepID=A0A915YF98_9BACT|nr:DUF1361 domain-containing protein [Aureispira anguillae]BDS11959.1 DUF1361 domain-containing protein [Aureispira anguillae]
MKTLLKNSKQYIVLNPFLTTLFLLFSYDFGLILFRIFYSDGYDFRFLVWNLFLAFLPFVFMQVAVSILAKKRLNVLAWIMFGVSLLFLPNSPYIITDLFHLKYWKHSAPLWFDTLLIFSYALTGVILFYATLLLMERFLNHYLPSKMVQLSLLMVIFLNAFGIYLGRYMRFNSWDIIASPMGLAQEILERFMNPYAHPRTWGLTLGYGLLFLVGFYCIKLFQQSIQKSYQLQKTA